MIMFFAQSDYLYDYAIVFSGFFVYLMAPSYEGVLPVSP